mgnify:CR=1 FL=1
MIINQTHLKNIRKKFNSITFTAGCWNLLHPGHIYLLKQCAQKGKIVVVSVSHDKITTRDKRVPVINQRQRMYILDNVRLVDFVILEEAKTPPNNIKNILRKLKPNKFVIGEDNANLKVYLGLCKELGIPIKLIKRNREGIFNISTTSIIDSINSKKRK